eukprot:gene20896-23729_t
MIQSVARGFRLGAPRFLTKRFMNEFHSSSVSSNEKNINYEFITSANNPKVKFLKSLQTAKKREETQLVLVEGHRMVIDAVKAGAVLNTVMFTQKSMSTPLGEKLDSILRTLHTKCVLCEVPDHVLATVSETVTSQGVIAAFEKPLHVKQELSKILHNKQPDEETLLVVLDGVRDPGNMGTLIRTAYGLGANAVVAVSGCDVWSSKVLRAATGVQLLADVAMPVLENDSWDHVHAYLQKVETANKGKNLPARIGAQREVQIIVSSSYDDADSVPYYEVDYTCPSVIVVGSEATGVSDAARACPGKVIKVRIPMVRELDSFNAGVAGAMLLAEAAKQRQVQRK